MPQKAIKKTDSKTVAAPSDASITELKRKKIAELKKLQPSDKLEILIEVGLGKEFFTCYRCGKPLSKKGFYVSTDLSVKTNISPVCRECAREIACPVNLNTGEPMNPTKDSCKNALFYLNRAWQESLWEASLLEAANEVTGRTKNSVWTALIKNTSMPQNITMTWREGDAFQTNANFGTNDADEISKTVLEAFEQNKADAIRLLDYEPFEHENIADQPFMYSQLVTYLNNGEEGNKDPMRISSIIEIIKGFDHRNKINNMIATYMNDKTNILSNLTTIKALEETKTKIGKDIQVLAQESKISLNSNKTMRKGESTWTGQLQALKEKNLRSAEENLIDIDTCRGMRQVAELSDSALLTRLALDESTSVEVISQQRRLLTKFKYAYQDAAETARLLLQENDDLKARLMIVDKDYAHNLKPSKREFYITDTEEQNTIDEAIFNYQGIDMYTVDDESDSTTTETEDNNQDDDEDDEDDFVLSSGDEYDNRE